MSKKENFIKENAQLLQANIHLKIERMRQKANHQHHQFYPANPDCAQQKVISATGTRKYGFEPCVANVRVWQVRIPGNAHIVLY